jgi:hypothetical protein
MIRKGFQHRCFRVRGAARALFCLAAPSLVSQMPLPAAAAAPPVPTLPVVGARAWAGRGDLAWSPAGTLAFVEAKAETAADFFPSTVKHWYSTHHLFVLGRGAARPVEVAGTQGAAAPTWSCNGKSLLFVSGDALWLLSRLGRAPVRVAWPLRPPSDWGSYYGEVDGASGFAWSGGYSPGGRGCSSSPPLRAVS